MNNGFYWISISKIIAVRLTAAISQTEQIHDFSTQIVGIENKQKLFRWTVFVTVILPQKAKIIER